MIMGRFLLVLLCFGVAHTEEAWVIGSDGAELTATSPMILSRPICFVHDRSTGVQATFFATSLRGVRQDDWRTSQTIAGSKIDTCVDQPASAFGSETERKRFGISGQPGNWDEFSVQWDGYLRVPPDGADVATASDDGSRVWLDFDRNGTVDTGEWGSNGWGNGQGTTHRMVHAGVPGGGYTIRIQFEEGGGGNACTLRWRSPGSGLWTTVPPEAFSQTPILRLNGPITLHATFEGVGNVVCGEGVVLKTAPTSGNLILSGAVTLAGDLTNGLNLQIPAQGRLDLAGRRLQADQITGSGSILLSGGRIDAASGSGLHLVGPGTLHVSGMIELGGLDARVQVILDPGASVRSPGRCVIRTTLASPLATVVDLGEQPTDCDRLHLMLDGPLSGVGLVVWRADRHGRWYQRGVPTTLRDGRQELEMELSDTSTFSPIGHADAWNANSDAECRRVGLLFYADRPVTGSVLSDTSWTRLPSISGSPRLVDVVPGASWIETGKRIELSVRPEPYPLWPLDPESFDLQLAVTAPDGKVTSYSGFASQPFTRHDRGDRESLTAAAPSRFAVRFRARQAGTHRLRLSARWSGGASAAVDLPDVLAEGPTWDDIARPDSADPRFLSAQSRMIWPIGQNLNSTYDVRSRQALNTRLTPDRGSFTREAFLARLIAAGGTGCETWLSPWNLGLEWTDAWPGFHGAGRPNLGNAWALDRFLDLAEEHDVRVVLSIFNHGQGRDGSGAEDDFPHHPWRNGNGGWLDSPAGLFTDPRARRGQEQLFRYLAARWGDSPAVLTWKLWAEVNLVHAPVEDVRTWHAFASDAFARHDPWRHPVTTHWCGDWNNADPVISGQPGMGMLTIDAYHDQGLIADLLAQSTRRAGRDSGGLAEYRKPVLVTEYGGSPMATSPARLDAELQIGGWAALVHGHAGTPMLWWFEWIDQGDRYSQFGALRRFTAGEDLRSSAARTIAPKLQTGSTTMWCRAWLRPGRALGYAFDPAWADDGRSDGDRPPGILSFGSLSAGRIHMQWWDAARGVIQSTDLILHPGGDFTVPSPAFQHHIAFKMWRDP